LGDLFDAGDKEEGGDLVLWWNDLEKDRKYKSWSKDLKDVSSPAQLRAKAPAD
jgi:UDP-glucose:glycoprotein glucosyltransferase